MGPFEHMWAAALCLPFPKTFTVQACHGCTGMYLIHKHLLLEEDANFGLRTSSAHPVAIEIRETGTIPASDPSYVRACGWVDAGNVVEVNMID